MNIINPTMKVIDDFHFAFEVVDRVDGERVVVVRDAVHSLLSCTGQPSGGDANSVSAQKYPYRFHCYTSHIYVDAFLNDSPNQVLYFKPKGESL